MNEVLSGCAYFGIALSLITYWIGYSLNQRFKLMIINPMLISMLLIIGFLLLFNVDYETYDYGAKYITYFLTPATICLAVPLYKQLQVLKKNLGAIIAGVLTGCIVHALIVAGLAVLFKLDGVLTVSILPKSVTTAIAMGVSEEVGGIEAITVVGVCIAGLMGAILSPVILKLFRITEPAAQGLAIGTASHALGTSKACEMGELQAAMSSLAIVVTGILTVIVVPIVAKYLFTILT